MNSFWINFQGQSMSPLLKTGDEIFIESVPYDQLICGDIILFIDHSSLELTLHRLMKKPLVTKGDFSLFCEENPKDCFLGRACGYKRKDGYLQFPSGDSLFMQLLSFFSMMRTKGFFLRKWAYVGLVVTTKAFELYSGKTRIGHSEAPKEIGL